MLVVLVGGEKGGTGKSTIATNLAAYLACRGSDVVLLDADSQATAARWVERRNSFCPGLPRVHCVQKTGDVFETIRDLAGRYQQVIVDAGGRDSEEFRSAMVAADRLYTPVKASQPDLETALNVSRLVKLACGLNPRLRAYAVVSMASTHPAVTEAREARELLAELAEIGALPGGDPGAQGFPGRDRRRQRSDRVRKQQGQGRDRTARRGDLRWLDDRDSSCPMRPRRRLSLTPAASRRSFKEHSARPPGLPGLDSTRKQSQPAGSTSG